MWWMHRANKRDNTKANWWKQSRLWIKSFLYKIGKTTSKEGSKKDKTVLTQDKATLKSDVKTVKSDVDAVKNATTPEEKKAAKAKYMREYRARKKMEKDNIN